MQPTNPLPKLRALEVRFYGPTNTKGARIRIRDLRGRIQCDLWLSYDHAHDSAASMAREALESWGWVLEYGAKTRDAHLWLTREFRRDEWGVPASQEAAQ